MRLLFALLVITVLSAKSQIINNLIDLEVSLSVEKPMGAKDQNGIKALNSNMELGYGLNIGTTYRVNNHIRSGIRYSNRTFINHQFKEELPLLGNPQTKFNQFLLDLNYLTGKKDQFGLNISAGPVFHQINIDELKIIADTPPTSFKTKFKELEFTTEIGAIVLFDINYDLKLLGRLNYRFTSANNLLYVDKSFQGLGLSVGIVKKILKNKHFQYE